MNNANVKTRYEKIPDRWFRQKKFSNSNQIIPVFCNSSSVSLLCHFIGYKIGLLYRHRSSPSVASNRNHDFYECWSGNGAKKASITVINYIKNAFWNFWRISDFIKICSVLWISLHSCRLPLDICEYSETKERIFRILRKYFMSCFIYFHLFHS